MTPNAKLAASLVANSGGVITALREKKHVVISFRNRNGVPCTITTGKTPTCPYAARKMQRTIEKLSALTAPQFRAIEQGIAL
jgi:hypothetical protein